MCANEVNNDGFRFHTPQADKDAEKHQRGWNLDAASKAIIINFDGHKGKDDDVYIEANGKKMKVKDISVWLDKLDTNKDGIISKEEVEKGGGDALNLLKLNGSEEEQKHLTKDMQKEQSLAGIKGMQTGLKQKGASWIIAKPIVKKYVTKQSLLKMLNNPTTKEYIDQTIKSDSTMNSHIKEIMKDVGFTPDEMKKYGF